MVITDLAFEFGRVLFRERLTRPDISRIFDVPSGNLSRLLHKELPTQQLVYILDTMGYDVKIEFVPKDGSNLNTIKTPMSAEASVGANGGASDE